jgi:hypothetical protein
LESTDFSELAVSNKDHFLERSALLEGEVIDDLNGSRNLDLKK